MDLEQASCKIGDMIVVRISRAAMYSLGHRVEEKHRCDNGGGVASTFDILMIADNVDGERSSVLWHWFLRMWPGSQGSTVR